MTPLSFFDRNVAAATLITLAIAACRFDRPPRLRPLTHLNLDTGPLPLSRGGVMAVSPDGSRMAVVVTDGSGVSRLRNRALDPGSAIDGTEGAAYPFFSPDGRWMGFAAEGKLKRVAAEGGAVEEICDAPDVRGASWADNGEVVFASESKGGLWHVPSTGGSPASLTKLEPGESAHRWPQVLPGSETVLFSSHASDSALDDGRIEALHLKTGRRKRLRPGGFAPLYVAVSDGSARLLYAEGGIVFAVGFDAATLDIHGAPIPVVRGIHSSDVAGAAFAIGPGGAAAVVAAGPAGAVESGPPTRLTSLLNFSDYLQAVAAR